MLGSEKGLKGDLAGGGTLRSGVAVQYVEKNCLEISHIKTTGCNLLTCAATLIFYPFCGFGQQNSTRNRDYMSYHYLQLPDSTKLD